MLDNGRDRAPRGPGPQVYPPREDTELLVPFALASGRSRFLELGVGSGRVVLCAAAAGARAAGTDLNPQALRWVRAEATRLGLRVELVRADGLRGLGRFDRVAANPPYLPTAPGEADPDRWVDLALNGGPDGTRVLREWLRELPAHLRRPGRAAVVVSSRQEPGALEEILATWRAGGGTVHVAERRRLDGEELRRLELAIS